MELWHPLLGRVVEAQYPFVAEQQERGRDKRLRHRGDAEATVGAGLVLLPHMERAQPARVDEHAVHDDAIGDAGRQWRILRQVRREDLVDICALFVVHAEIKHPLGTWRACWDGIA